MAQKTSSNTFKLSSLPHNAIQFDLIKDDDYLPALKAAIEAARQTLDQIRNNPKPATFENTCEALDALSDQTDYVSTIFYNQLSSHTNDKLQALANEIGPILSNFGNDITLDQKLFSRVRDVYEKRASLKLTVEQNELLETQYKDFVRNGANLSESDKQILREIDAESSKLAPQFSENVLKATNEFVLHVTNEKDLDGLPEMSRLQAKADAEARKLDGWVFTLQAPSFVPFLQFAKNRGLREKIHRAYGSRAFGDKYDNQKITLRIVELREKRAKLLGYKTHAHFVLERRMAETPERVVKFLKRIEDASITAAKKDVAAVEKFAKELDGIDQLQAWDFSYYSEKLKEKIFQFSSEELRPYFQLDKVIDGVFAHAKKLYGLDFTPVDNYPVYHPDVRAYDVTEEGTGRFIGLFYADFFPRDSKKGGAWMTSYINQGLLFGEVRRPHIAIVCNFTKPSGSKPSLLSYDEVNTLFHEFGHALHGLLSQCRYKSLAGTNVRWDFVELPSQIMENWTLEKESLDLFASHYETGAPIPAELAKKLRDSAKFMAGYTSLRQVNFATLDMAWHTTPFSEIKDVDSFEKSKTEHLRILPKVVGTNFSCGFSHIFAGGYSAGYYSYKWAEVLDADAFEYFKEKGIFNREVARKFREHILERGGTEPPLELYKRFRGREPDPDALLRRDGLI